MDAEEQPHFDDVMEELQKGFDLFKQIQNLIYQHSDDSKFIYNEMTKRQQISPKWMHKINEYTIIKRLIIESVIQDTNVQIVDTQLLLSFIYQYELKKNLQPNYNNIQSYLYEIGVAKPNKMHNIFQENSAAKEEWETEVIQTIRKMDRFLT